MISLEKWMILAPLLKLSNNVGDLGKFIVAKFFKKWPKVQKSPTLVTLEGRGRGRFKNRVFDEVWWSNDDADDFLLLRSS